jgi:radical SAM superfamily enzyme YgiQ (UPF0313 family)
VKITLIEPPRYYSPTSPVSTVVIPPLGLAYISGTLEKAGHDVTIVDALSQGLDKYTPFGSIYLRGLSIQELCGQIPEDTELIGVSSMFSAQWLVVRELLKEVKRRFPHVPLVLGGEHGTALPDLCMTHAPIDYIVLGEGEDTIKELVARLEKGLPARDVAGASETSTRFRSRPGICSTSRPTSPSTSRTAPRADASCRCWPRAAVPSSAPSAPARRCGRRPGCPAPPPWSSMRSRCT